MKNYLREIFSDILLSIVTKKYGTSLNDYQREEKADEIIQVRPAFHAMRYLPGVI